METYSIIVGDCLNACKTLADDCIDLIITSPPYADSRSKLYGGIMPDKYVEWFIPRSEQFLRILKPDGTFVLNIKEKVVNGERHTYVIDLIKALREQGWLWTEEFIWHKKNCYPGKWPNRFRDAWERCLQFNRNKKFRMYQDAVMVPKGDWAKGEKISKKYESRIESETKSGFGKSKIAWAGRDLVYPSNVIHLATECANKKHPAAFPKGLPEWFIKLFTLEGDLVLDPFAGSCTTIDIAVGLGRRCIGIESNDGYVPKYLYRRTVL